MKWIDEVRGSDSIREVARRTGMNQATLNRQINLDMLTFETVRDISRAYNRAMLADLVTTGHLAVGDLGVDDIENALNAASDAQLVAAVADRLGVDLGIFDKPITEAFAEASNVTTLHRNVPTPVQNDRRVAKKKSRDPGGDEGDF